MNNPLASIASASRVVLGKRGYALWGLALTAVLFASYVLLPVWLTPGNTLSFQLGLLRLRDYALFAALSLLTALLLLLQAYLFAHRRTQRVSALGKGAGGLFSALFAGMLATAACSSCIAAVIGFLGAGSVFFVIGHTAYFVWGGIALVLLGLYASARRIEGYCKDCDALASEKNA